MGTKHSLVLRSVLQVMRPLVRLLLCHGVTYPAVAGALKSVFVQAAQDELARQGMARTDSALTLLSGVHRKDVRELRQPEATAPRSRRADGQATPLGLAGEVVGRWMSDRAFRGRQGPARRLPKSGEGSFDALVASVSQDVRPRAMLDELLRLGVVSEGADGIALLEGGFTPRQGFAEMSGLLADNLGDHAAAAAANLQEESNFLEQAIYVDQISAESALHLEQVAKKAWAQAFKRVMHEARMRFDADAVSVPADQRQHRARFGVYYFSEPQKDTTP